LTKYYLKNPQLSSVIESRYGSFKSLVYIFTNLLCYTLHLDVVPMIIGIQFESTNLCNLKCLMCPVNTVMKRKKNIISFDLFKKTLDQFTWLEYIMLQNWGEPLLHPRIFDMINYAKRKGIKVFMYTNGTLLTHEKMIKLIDSRIDRITISIDSFDETYEKIRGFNYKEIENKILELVKLRNENKSRMYIEISMVVFDETEDKVKNFMKKWEGIVDHVAIQPKLEYNTVRKTRCKELWRGNIIILSNGLVVPCCYDYEGLIVLGDANKQSIKEIWNSKVIRRLRDQHNKHNFTGLCRGCGEFKTKFVKPRFR